MNAYIIARFQPNYLAAMNQRVTRQCMRSTSWDAVSTQSKQQINRNTMIYIEGFESKEDIADKFSVSATESIVIFNEIKLAKPFFALYDREQYQGTAIIFFIKNKKLYEVHGSHCSCYGLEDQWVVEEVSKEALKHRLDNATSGLLLHNKNKIKEIFKIKK